MIYIPLQLKTSYTLLSSLIRIPDLIQKAKSLGYQSLAITDHNNMFGVPAFYQECKKNNIKPVIGLELEVEDKNILLYAMNNQGYKNLIKLSTIVSERNITLEDLTLYQNDLILVIPYSFFNEEIYNIYKYHYIGYSTKEEQDKIKEDKVFINNVSYLEKEDHKYLDYLIMIKEQKVIGEYHLNENSGHHLMNEQELLEHTTTIDINTTKEIADLCNVEISYTNNLLPVYDEKINAYDYLKYLCQKGLKKRLNNNIPEIYITRLEKELIK